MAEQHPGMQVCPMVFLRSPADAHAGGLTFLAVMSTRVHGLVWTCGFGSLGTRRSGIAGLHGDCLTAEESLVSILHPRLPFWPSAFRLHFPHRGPSVSPRPNLGPCPWRLVTQNYDRAPLQLL